MEENKNQIDEQNAKSSVDCQVSKLSKKALEAYNYMKRPGTKAYYNPYMGRFSPNAYWFISDAPGKWTKQIEKLIESGLVEIIESDWRGKTAIAKSC